MILTSMMAQAVALLAEAAPAAPASPSPGGSSLFGLPMMMILMMVVLFVVTGGSQRKKQRAIDELQKSLQAGDEIVTAGGAHGVITTVREKTVIVRVNEGKIEFDRSAIAQRLPKEVAAVVENRNA